MGSTAMPTLALAQTGGVLYQDFFVYKK